jgi:hypothetical protein
VIDKEVLLQYLPPVEGNSKLITEDQVVTDIITEVIKAHKWFEHDYDGIYFFFDDADIRVICKRLFDFCKNNISYKKEPKENQTTRSPSLLLEMGNGDCKHYAGFIGGVLAAMQRHGKKINWCYRFASYDWFDSTPQHVFVVVKTNNGEIWVDPVLDRLDERYLPKHTPIDKKINVQNMALYRLSGIGLPQDYKGYIPQTTSKSLTDEQEMMLVDDYIDEEITPDVEDKIKMMLYYGLLNEDGSFNEARLTELHSVLSEDDFNEILDGYSTIVRQAGGVGNLFSTIWRGVKKISLAIPRGAYLACVSLNIFGWGTKLWKAAFNEDGSYYQPGQTKVRDRWYSLGGDWKNLEGAIKSGHKKPKILGDVDQNQTVYYAKVGEMKQIGIAPAVIIASASAIIAALAPIIKSILDMRQKEGFQLTAEDLQLPPDPTQPTVMEQLQKYLPYLLLAGAAAYFFLQKRKR